MGRKKTYKQAVFIFKDLSSVRLKICPHVFAMCSRESNERNHFFFFNAFYITFGQTVRSERQKLLRCIFARKPDFLWSGRQRITKNDWTANPFISYEISTYIPSSTKDGIHWIWWNYRNVWQNLDFVCKETPSCISVDSTPTSKLSIKRCKLSDKPFSLQWSFCNVYIEGWTRVYQSFFRPKYHASCLWWWQWRGVAHKKSQQCVVVHFDC